MPSVNWIYLVNKSAMSENITTLALHETSTKQVVHLHYNGRYIPLQMIPEGSKRKVCNPSRMRSLVSESSVELRECSKYLAQYHSGALLIREQ